MPQFNQNLRAQFIEGVPRKFKTFEFENARIVIQENLATTEKKIKQYIRQIKYSNDGHLPANFTSSIDIRGEPVVPHDVPLAENILTCGCKQMLKIMNDKLKY